MTVSDVLNVMSVCDKTRIINDNTLEDTEYIYVSEAMQMPGIDKLPVGSMWVSIRGYLVIEVGFLRQSERNVMDDANK